MASINTNISAMAALQALRSVHANMAESQDRVSSGLRVETPSDNAAYWAISTTMRAESSSLVVVSEALDIGASKVDIAYVGLEAVIGVLGTFKDRLVAAGEASADKPKIQGELEQLKQQVLTVAQSASFNGENWLNTDIADIYDRDINKVSVLSSLVRDALGQVSMKTMDVHLSSVSLFNSTEGGLLQKDTRDIKSIGGIRQKVSNWDGATLQEWWVPRSATGNEGGFDFTFSGPITFANPGDEIKFKVTVDADNPADGIPGPHNVGRTSGDIVINRAVLDAVNPGWNGVISNYTQYAVVLDHVLAGTGASARTYRDLENKPITDRIGIFTDENRAFGLDGSFVSITSLTSTLPTAGLANNSAFGDRGSDMVLGFEPFQVYEDGDTEDGIEVSFTFSINGAPSTSHSFDRTYVNELLGKDTGKVETAEEMVLLLDSLLLSNWPNLLIETTSTGGILMKSDEQVDRRSGSDTGIAFGSMVVSNEPLRTMNFLDIDIVQNPGLVESYLSYLDAATARVIEGAAIVGALQTRIEIQADFTKSLKAAIDRGIGNLVDADMNEESARLKALQAQEQLANQSLSMANATPELILQLFK